MEEIRNKYIELSELVITEIEKLTDDEQDLIYNMGRRSQVSDKDNKIYVLCFLYEFLNEKLPYINKISQL